MLALDTTEMVTVRVLAGCVVNDGDRLHGAGSIVTVPPDMAALLVREQGVEPVD
jgi:hypothetical protein